MNSDTTIKSRVELLKMSDLRREKERSGMRELCFRASPKRLQIGAWMGVDVGAESVAKRGSSIIICCVAVVKGSDVGMASASLGNGGVGSSRTLLQRSSLFGKWRAHNLSISDPRKIGAWMGVDVGAESVAKRGSSIIICCVAVVKGSDVGMASASLGNGGVGSSRTLLQRSSLFGKWRAHNLSISDPRRTI
ncbi:uncharacterized protein LOC103942569 isoform X3 [Pyrus x bretschneideri]|uniref:uncharacterized protein LOC103942569 isoform X3 n=1 Tax=Pyrus x bretschneideri TaxID=225117 RepID=UPI002030362D|nr:uncharacterized protein LOC103942569 isoform X3 [Pyrus x bretschneideri]